jgi:cellulose biosynthesis protein BcsQ
MNQPIVFVSGSKGGVGKSITSMAVLDYLAAEHHEADTTNPDVWKS